MTRLFTAIALCAALCSCTSERTVKKSSKPASEQTLGQRLNQPDTSRRSQYEKYMATSKDGRGTGGMQFQKQMFNSSAFSGSKHVAGISNATGMNGQYKTQPSMFSRLKFWGNNSAFKGSNQTNSAATQMFNGAGAFKTGSAREGSMNFSGAGDVFETNPALTRNDRIGRAPKIIENFGGTSTSGAGYSESEVKQLLNRN